MNITSQKGSATMLAIFVLVFVAIVMGGLIPFVNTQVNLTTKNQDVVEAQYAAEAGAKRAIVSLENSKTTWAWIANNIHNAFLNDVTKKYFTVSMVPTIVDGSTPTPGTTYTITSTGYVGSAQKKVILVVKTASPATGGAYNYAAFSNGAFTMNNNSIRITGDVDSNTSVNFMGTNNQIVSGYAYAPNGAVINNQSAGIKIATLQSSLTIPTLASLMPSFSMTGIDITTTWTNGQWGGNTYSLTGTNYYYNGDYYLNGHNYSIPTGHTVAIYINGSFTLYSPYTITGGSIVIYATNGITFGGGSIAAGVNGTVSLYTPGAINVQSGSYINGSTVTIVAYNGVTLSGGSINQSLSGAVTKIYTNNFLLNNASSVISGKGSGMVEATNNIELDGGTAATTLMIAGNNILLDNSGVTVGGLYSNGTINITGGNVVYNSSTASALGLSSGTGTAFSIVSWNNQ